MPDFPGLKISQDHKIRQRPAWGVERIRVRRGQDKILMDQAGVVGWGGNSGFHAINLAAQFNVRGIILVGYDMQLQGGLHWHGRHPSGLNNPTPGSVDRWRRVTDHAAFALADLGITVINASPVSALVAYPKMSLKEALECLEPSAFPEGSRSASTRQRSIAGSTTTSATECSPAP